MSFVGHRRHRHRVGGSRGGSMTLKYSSIASICFLANGNIQPIYAVWWFELVTDQVVLNLYAYVIYHKMHK